MNPNMDSVHFRFPHDLTQIMDAAVKYNIFSSRSSGLRKAATHAILGDWLVQDKAQWSVQDVYDNLAMFNSLVIEFKSNASYFIEESLVGNLDPLIDYMAHEEEVLERFPMFWQDHFFQILRAIPEYRVIESCLTIGNIEEINKEETTDGC